MSQNRFELLPQAAAGFRAFSEGCEAFQRETGVSLAEGMLVFAEHISEEYLAFLDGITPWSRGYFGVDCQLGQAVGMGGFKARPDTQGSVEIAYCTAPELENRGYATRMARALVELAHQQPEVRLVIAHTLPTPNASARVLTKCGFQRTGEVVDPDDGPVWRWECLRGSEISADFRGVCRADFP
ncbi:Aminoglycoside N(6')-acetyltransferase type 1 [Caulifigura coniformis]|uniref:Aminoglycoside N(6')-acetyltransferase type 1 n=1 Tax=Caulifigura coniformis TaxID=2527983 RepID=A0A517SC58_9PLAN|nr:GNAT family N-acetyltransferase [Caulifigura coniformis]QDT53718.1 Aminoglycoside N(6')-acetyltransferase type 1 [Caulifigura coniformis]